MGDVNITPAIFMSQDLFFGQIMLGQPRSPCLFFKYASMGKRTLDRWTGWQMC